MTEFIGVKGTKHDLSRLKEILNDPGSIKFWLVGLDPTSSNTNRSVQVITSENKHTISYQEYRNLIKNKNEHDFIYDDLNHRFYKKDHPSIPSGRRRGCAATRGNHPKGRCSGASLLGRSLVAQYPAC